MRICTDGGEIGKDTGPISLIVSAMGYLLFLLISFILSRRVTGNGNDSKIQEGFW